MQNATTEVLRAKRNRRSTQNRLFNAITEQLEPRRHLSASTSRAVWNGQEVNVVPGQWIARVTRPSGVRGALDAHISRELSAKAPRLTLRESLGGSGLYLINTPKTWSQARIISELKKINGYRFSEPNISSRIADAEVNDPLLATSDGAWWIRNTGQAGGVAGADVKANAAWDISTGQGVVIAVNDTGVDIDHPELVNQLWRNPGEIPGDNIDNDNNGFVDDVNGYNFKDNNANLDDDQGHGTAIAGLIAGQANNNLFGAGLAYNARIMALKWRSNDGTGGFASVTSDAIRAINYTTLMKQRGVNIRASNNSYGEAPSAALETAINNLVASGVVFVASAGNEQRSIDNPVRFPASYPASFVVSSTNRNDILSSFSNFGPNTVDIAAPGEDILTLFTSGGPTRVSGTSFAAAVVSGAVALLASAKPTATVAEIENALRDGADRLPVLAGTSRTGARLNARRSLEIISGTNPPPPTNFATVNGFVFNDTNNTGFRETTSEPGIANWVVYHDANRNGTRDVSETFATTTATGAYTLRVPTGEQRIRAEARSGFVQTSQPSTTYQTVWLEAGQTDPSPQNFGFRSTSTPTTGTVNGAVFTDTNLSGTRETGELGIANVRVYVDVNRNNAFDSGEPSTFTSSTGTYTLQVPTAEQRLRAVAPAGFVQTTQATTGGSQTIWLGAGDTDPFQQLFGFRSSTTPGPTGTVNGAVYADANANATRDGGELGLANFRVYVDSNRNGSFDSGETSVLTSSTGTYSIAVPIGEQYLRVAQQANFTQTTQGGPNGFQLVWLSAGQTDPFQQLFGLRPANTPPPPPPPTGQTPFLGVATTVRAGTVIQAENYDNGGQGVSFFDVDQANNFGSPQQDYRGANSWVDVRNIAGGGRAVGWTVTGEWQEHTISVPTAGTFIVDIRYSSNIPNAKVQLARVNGPNIINVTPVVDLPFTSNWENFRTQVVNNVSLPAGNYVLRLSWVSSGADVDSISFRSPAGLVAASTGVKPIDAAPTPKPVDRAWWANVLREQATTRETVIGQTKVGLARAGLLE
jgi:subtilisin family serine protease